MMFAVAAAAAHCRTGLSDRSARVSGHCYRLCLDQLHSHHRNYEVFSFFPSWASPWRRQSGGSLGLVWDILSWFAILTGSAFLLIGSIGLVRLPDMFTRSHATGVTETLATYLLILGMAFQAGLSLVTVKLIVIALFMFFASPTSTHALTRAALDGGMKPEVDEDRRPDDRELGAGK